MGLILCSVPPSEEGFRIDDLGIRIYSLEELCYCLRQYPILFLEEFPDRALLSFLSTGLGETSLASQLLSLQENGSSPPSLILKLMEGSGLCGTEELGAFRAELMALTGLPELERLQKKSDLLFSLKRYGRVLSVCGRLRGVAREGLGNSGLLADILVREGCAAANLFRFEEARERFLEAWKRRPETDTLKKLYFLARLQGGEEPALEDLPDRERLEENRAAWDREFEEAQRAAEKEPEYVEALEAFYGDPVQREKKAAALVARMKRVYREQLI